MKHEGADFLQAIINNFQIAELKLVLAITGLVITFFTLLTARSQIEVKRKEYYALNLIFILAFIFILFNDNWILFVISWEMITVSTALMLLWRSRGLSGQYLIIQFLGSSFLIYFIILAISNGYTEIMPIKEFWLQNLFIFGLGLKSAVFGVHFWLPPVHSQAPSPVSALLSGWVVKIGFIMYLRIIPQGNILLLILGIMMIFYGGIKALLAWDFKVLLAYSSISQLGFIAIGIGSGTVIGYLGSILHIIAHGLAKTLLFSSSGYLVALYNSRTIYDFEETSKRPVILNLGMLTGFGSLIGIPLTAGFNSKYFIKYLFHGEKLFQLKSIMPDWLIYIFKVKFLTYFNIVSINHFFELVMYSCSLLTGLYSIRFLYWSIFRHWLGKRDKESGQKNPYMLKRFDYLALLISIFFLLIVGVYNSIIIKYISDIGIHHELINGFVEIIIISILSIIILYKFRWFKTECGKIPTIDHLFNKINKNLYISSRYIYNIVYQDFQLQLLWIPVFLVLLFGWIFVF